MSLLLESSFYAKAENSFAILTSFRMRTANAQNYKWLTYFFLTFSSLEAIFNTNQESWFESMLHLPQARVKVSPWALEEEHHPEKREVRSTHGTLWEQMGMGIWREAQCPSLWVPSSMRPWESRLIIARGIVTIAYISTQGGRSIPRLSPRTCLVRCSPSIWNSALESPMTATEVDDLGVGAGLAEVWRALY